MVPFILGSLWQDRMSVGLSLVQCPSLSSRGWEQNGLPGAMLTNVRTHARTHSLTFPSRRAPGVPPRRCTAQHSWSAASVRTPLELLALTFPRSPDPNGSQYSLGVRGPLTCLHASSARTHTHSIRDFLSHFGAGARCETGKILALRIPYLGFIQMGIFLPL